jgi:hypothetical protein
MNKKLLKPYMALYQDSKANLVVKKRPDKIY